MFSELGVTEGDGLTPELDKWAVRWAVILETWVRDGGVLEGSKGWEWSPLVLLRFFPNLEKGNLLFLTVGKTTQGREKVLTLIKNLILNKMEYYLFSAYIIAILTFGV